MYADCTFVSQIISIELSRPFQLNYFDHYNWIVIVHFYIYSLIAALAFTGNELGEVNLFNFVSRTGSRENRFG